MTQCLVFWLPGAIALCEDLFNMLIVVAIYPQHAYGFVVRLLLFTLVPAAFISWLSVEAVRDWDPLEAFAVLGAAILYGGLAVILFDRGVRRYASGNRVLELR